MKTIAAILLVSALVLGSGLAVAQIDPSDPRLQASTDDLPDELRFLTDLLGVRAACDIALLSDEAYLEANDHFVYRGNESRLLQLIERDLDMCDGSFAFCVTVLPGFGGRATYIGCSVCCNNGRQPYAVCEPLHPAAHCGCV